MVWGFESPPAHHITDDLNFIVTQAVDCFHGLEISMTVTVETLGKLERKITLTIPADSVQNEVSKRIKEMARKVKMDGFRPGKVPVSVVSQQYGYSVQHEVMQDKVGAAFATAANEAQLRVVGQPRITENRDVQSGQLSFDAVFEVYPEVKVGSLGDVEIEQISTDVTEAAIDRTVEILRKQRRHFALRPADQVVMDTDRVTIDFAGKIDGEPFEGGTAENFQFIVGDGQMLQEFEDAVRGMKAGESKTFPMAFPDDYHGKDVAGKTADFMVTVNKIETAHLPDVNGDFAQSLGIVDGTVDALRVDIKKNLEREVRHRLQARNKQAAMDALSAAADLDLPKSVVQAEIDRLTESARADLKQRGIKGADKLPVPEDLFRAQAERRVRLGLVVAEVVRERNLHATPAQIKNQIEDLAASYERPADVMRWYQSDSRRMAEIEAMVVETNVTNYVFSQAKVIPKTVPFDELMGKG